MFTYTTTTLYPASPLIASWRLFLANTARVERLVASGLDWSAKAIIAYQLYEDAGVGMSRPWIPDPETRTRELLEVMQKRSVEIETLLAIMDPDE